MIWTLVHHVEGQVAQARPQAAGLAPDLGGTDVVVQAGKSVHILLVAPAKGPYDLTCADHDWDGMIGSITVD